MQLCEPRRLHLVPVIEHREDRGEDADHGPRESPPSADDVGLLLVVLVVAIVVVVEELLGTGAVQIGAGIPALVIRLRPRTGLAFRQESIRVGFLVGVVHLGEGAVGLMDRMDGLAGHVGHSDDAGGQLYSVLGVMGVRPVRFWVYTEKKNI